MDSIFVKTKETLFFGLFLGPPRLSGLFSKIGVHHFSDIIALKFMQDAEILS